MRNLDQHSLTDSALERIANCPDARLKEVMTALIRHLHEFAREVKLTPDEWMKGVEFLTAVGHITDDKRQEFILLSDTLGLSMLVTAQNNVRPAGCTEATVFGPFFVQGAPEYKNGADISNGAKGAPCFVSGQIRTLEGKPIAGVS